MLATWDCILETKQTHTLHPHQLELHLYSHNTISPHYKQTLITSRLSCRNKGGQREVNPLLGTNKPPAPECQVKEGRTPNHTQTTSKGIPSRRLLCRMFLVALVECRLLIRRTAAKRPSLAQETPCREA